MKSISHAFENIIDTENILQAMFSAMRGKKKSRSVRAFLHKDNIGIPIGFYSSQWFANFFLQDFDYYIKQELEISHYMRYMDDMVLISPNKRKLRRAKNNICLYLKNIGLVLNDNQQLFRFSYIDKQGKEKGRAIDFMGYVFHCNRTTIRKRTLCRTRKKANKIIKHSKHHWYEATQIVSMAGRMKGTDTHNYYDNYIKPKVNIQKMRKLISNHSKKQALEGRS